MAQAKYVTSVIRAPITGASPKPPTNSMSDVTGTLQRAVERMAWRVV
jgi:hypothetical protein